MPPAIPLLIGASAAAATVVLGGGVAVAAVVGVGAAIISHETGAADWVYDEIVEPVGNAVKDVLTSDIGQFVLKAGATLTGNAWAIPLIDGAGVIANGGDFGDALKSAAISYVGGKVGNLGGELASQALVDAGASEFATQVIGSAAGSGAGRASVALIMGQDPVEAFIQGGINGGLGAAAGWLETNTEGAFSKLPDAARNVITSGLSAAISGKELTPDLIWNALLTSEGVTKTVNTFLADNVGLSERLTDNQISALTLGIQRTTATAFSGGDVPQAVLNELNRYGEQEFGKWLDDSKFGDKVNNTLDKITGDFQRAQAQAEQMDGVVQQHSAAVGNYNATMQEINDGVATQERLRTAYERALQNFQANENQTNADALVAAVDAFNAHVNPFNERYNNVLKPNLDRYEQQVADLESQFEVEAQTYDTFVADLSVAADRVADELKPVYSELDKQFVKFMDPNFNEEEYRQIAGLDADDDAYLHWLSTGKEEGLPSNAADYEVAYNEARQRALMSSIERSGLDIGDVNPKQLQKLVDYIDQTYGGDLTRLRNAGAAGSLASKYIEDYFIEDYINNQRIIEAIDEEQRDINLVIDAWQGGQSLGIAPVITAQVNELLAAAGRPTGLVGEELVQEDVDALRSYSNRLTSDADPLRETVADFAPSNATEAEIAAGIARRIIDPDTGLMEWSNLAIKAPFWSPELGAMVYQYAIPIFDNVDTNASVTGYPEGVYAPAEGGQATGDFAYVYKNLAGEWVGGVHYQPASGLSDTAAGAVIGQTLADLRETAPAQFIEQAGSLSADAADIIAAQVGREITDLARNAVEYARESDSDFIKDTAAVAIGGTAELAGAINDVLLMAKINPESTPLGRWARDTLALSGDVRSEEFVAASKRFSDRYNAAEGAVGALNAIWDNAWDAPGYFLAEYVAQELIQEIPGALAGLVTGGVATLGLAAARRTALEISQEAGRTIARRAALSSVATLDMAESIGGSAGQGFDTAYSEALNAGMTEAEAIEFAYDTAVSAGVVGGVITGVSMGFLDGNAMERVIANRVTGGSVRDAANALTDKIRAGATVMVKEGRQEALEEGAVEAVIASRIVQINPDYDVAKNITLNATLGAIAGVGVAGGVYTADLITDTLLRVNPTVNNVIKGGGSDPEATKKALADLGITDAGTQNNLLSTVSDQYHSNADVSRAFSAHPDFRVTNADILNGVLNSAGQDVTTYINTYVDQRYVDIAEVKAAAAAEGVTLTDAQAQDMVTQTADPDATQAALYSIQQKYDPAAVTEQEAREAFAAQGFNPSNEQIEQFVREGAESDILTELGQFVNVNQVTEEEARQYFADIGYDATDAEVAQFVRQQAETAVQSELGAYVDPRMVDADEVRAAYESLGLTIPSASDIDALVGQYDQAELAGRAEENLPTARFNALQQQLVEFRQALENGGVPSDEIEAAIASVRADTMAEFEALGYTIDEEMGALRDNIADSEQRLMDQIAANEEAGMTRDEAIQAAVDELATEFGVAQDAIFDRIGETEQSLNDRISGVETAIGDLGTQIGDVEASLLGRVQELEDAGVTRDEAIQSAVDDLATELGTTREELLAEIGATEETLLQTVADAQTALEARITGVETAVLDRVQELEDAGIQRDTALQTALGELATELGVTEDSLLQQIGQTEQSLLDQLAGLEGQIGDVETRVLDRVQELEDAGIQRDTALQTALGELATELGVTEDSLLQQIGQTEQSLLDQLAGLEGQIGDVETRVLDRVQELEDAGIQRDTALQTALGELATELGVTEDSLLQQIGQTEQSLLDQLAGLEGQIGDVETRVLDRVQELEDAGIQRDTALQTALGELATELGVTEDSLLQQIGQTEQSLLDQLAGLEGQIGDVETRVLDRVQELEDAGIQRDTALQTALGELATELGVTEDSLLQQIGQTEQSLLDQLADIQTGLEGQIGDVETRVLDRVQELEDAGIQRDTALQTALGELATELGVTEDSLLQQIGQTEQSLLDQLAEIQTGLEGQIGDVETRVLDRVQELEDSGIARDTALQTALDELATELGVTEESLLEQIGQTEQSLLDQIGGVREDIGNVEDRLLSKVQELEDSGIARDTALQTALSELATELGITETTLLTQLGETAQSLQDQITGVAETNQADLDFVSSLIGKPARDVTQVDIDFVADLIAQQEVITDLNMSQRQYDVTGDGLINQDDFALLEQALAGTDVTFAPGSIFGPATGLYAQNQANLDAQLAAEAETQALIDQQTQNQTQLATQLQTQIETEADAARRRAFGDYVMQQEDVYGQRVDVKTPDPMRINYFYDFESIFANPQQASLFPTPYAKGGQVEDSTDKLLRILGELK
jgi:hypothetical protein